MANFQNYTTKEGERFDWIAVRVYGQDFPYSYEEIIRANPQYLCTTTLPAGVVVRIPVMENLTPTITREQLPPWRR